MHEVLEARVEVRLRAQAAHALEVRVVDVRVHAEKTLEDSPDHFKEVVREVSPVLLREDRRVVKLHVRTRASQPTAQALKPTKYSAEQFGNVILLSYNLTVLWKPALTRFKALQV